MFIYPNNELQSTPAIMRLLGGFWSRFYDGSEYVAAMMRGIGDLYLQTWQDLQEAAACVGRETIPLWHIEQWFPVVLLESQRNAEAGVWRFDDGNSLDAGLSFDTAYTSEHIFPLPAGIRGLAILSAQLKDPTVSFSDGVDYYINAERGQLVFAENPFDDERLSPLPLFADGVVADRQITLWAVRPRFERTYLFRHLGFLFGVERPSSEAYRRLLNTTMDAVTGGSAREQLDSLLHLLADTVQVQSRDEVVQALHEDDDFKWVFTDRQVYPFAKTAEFAVAVGDVVTPATPLTNAVERVELRMGELNSNLPAIVLSPDYLSPEISGALVFENRELPAEYADESVRFPIGGHPLDVEMFWTLVEARRETYGTLYETLRKANRLTATINPAAFLVEHVLRNSYTLYRIRDSACGPQPTYANPKNLLYRILPAWSALLLLVELTPLADSVTMGSVEEGEVFLNEAVDAESQTIGTEAIDDTDISIKVVGFTCV